MTESSDAAVGAGGSGERGVSKAGANVPEAILYVTSGCHLCSVARSLLVAVQRTIPFNIRTVNIEDDDELVKRFALEVPVVEIDGEIVARGQVDVNRVRAAVNEARIAHVRRAATGE
ncbi:MAG: glutaredoxin family protein [Dehalococcoidia bacterium]